VEKTTDSKPIRDLSLDLLKGTAVFFMIVTHVNAFFYNAQAAWLNFFTWWGATICFVTFVFAYGWGYGIKFSKGPLDKWPTFKRVLGILLGYYLVSGWIYLIWWGRPATPAGLLKIFLLLDLPEFTEFILSFVFYGALVLLFDRFFIKLARSFWLPVLGIATYVLSRYLYGLDWGWATAGKSLLVGHENLNRWGFLSFFAIFAFGVTFGYHFLKSPRRRLWQLGLFAVSALAVLLLSRAGFSSERWPPSVLYLFWGLAYSFGALNVFPLLTKLPAVLSFFSYLGRNALDFFIGSTLVTITAADLIGYRRFPEAATLAVLTGVLAINYLLSRLIRKTPSPS